MPNQLTEQVTRLAQTSLNHCHQYRDGEPGSPFDKLHKAHVKLAVALLKAAADYEGAIN